MRERALGALRERGWIAAAARAQFIRAGCAKRPGGALLEAKGVRGSCDLGGCNSRKTLLEAEAICSDAGVRLCTAEELQSDCSKSTGCGFDKELVWSSDS